MAEILWGERQGSGLRDRDRTVPVATVMAGSALAEASWEHGAKLRDAVSIPGRARRDNPSRPLGKWLVSIPRVQGTGYPVSWPTLLHMKSRGRLGVTHHW